MNAMASHSSETTVTFSYPFSLGAMDRPQPAGTYRVVSDDEELAHPSRHVLHRVSSFLHTPAVGGAGKVEVYQVSPNALASAQADDLRHAQAIVAERDSI